VADNFLALLDTKTEDLAVWVEEGNLLLRAELLEEGDFITMTLDGEKARQLRDWLLREFPPEG
jgi:hypothetical protein